MKTIVVAPLLAPLLAAMLVACGARLAVDRTDYASAPWTADSMTATFVFWKGTLHLSGCDGTDPIRVQVGGAYSDAAQLVDQLRTARVNAAVLTVAAQRERTAGANAQPPESLRLDRVLKKGGYVECNVTGADRPLVGTYWVAPFEPQLAPAKRPPRASERFQFRLGADGRLNGKDGCNSFFGPYTLTANGELTMSSVGTTQEACIGHKPLMSFGVEPKQVVIRGRQLTLSPGGHVFVPDDDRRP